MQPTFLSEKAERERVCSVVLGEEQSLYKPLEDATRMHSLR
jgi:hypothetical protein